MKTALNILVLSLILSAGIYLHWPEIEAKWKGSPWYECVGCEAYSDPRVDKKEVGEFSKKNVLMLSKKVLISSIMFKENGNSGNFLCAYCNKKSSKINGFKHNKDCIVIIAQNILANE